MQFLGWLIGVAALSLFFIYFFDVQQTKNLLEKISGFPALISVLCFLSAIVLRAIKWTFIMRTTERVRWREGYHTVMISNLINFLFPVRFGELAKLYIIKRVGHVPYSTSVSSILTDRFSQFFMILVSLLFLPIAGFRVFAWSSKLILVFVVFIVSAFAVFFYGMFFLEMGRKAGTKFLGLCGVSHKKIQSLSTGKAVAFIQAIVSRMNITDFRKRDVFLILLFSLLIISLDGAYYYFGIHTFGISVSFLQAVMGGCLMNLLFVLPTPPGQVGTAEMYPVLIFSWGIGLSSGDISSIAIFFHLVVAVVFAILGICSLFSLGMGAGTLFRSIRKETYDQ